MRAIITVNVIHYCLHDIIFSYLKSYKNQNVAVNLNFTHICQKHNLILFNYVYRQVLRTCLVMIF